MNYRIKSIIAALALLSCGSAFAEVTAEQAKQLGMTGTPLMPWGAERAGNKEGTIPAYTGEGVPVPASYNRAKPGVLTEAYTNEKPLFYVDSKNMAQYADKLTEGMKALLTKYPQARLNVYPSHRTVIYPKWFIENSLKNATGCKQEGPKLVGCLGGTPFPIPKIGTHLTWNHQLGFMGIAHEGRASTVLTDASGKVIIMGVNDFWFDWPYYFPSNNGTNVYKYERTRYDYMEPPRVSGERILLHYKIDNAPTDVWQYLPGQRRTKLSPNLAWDTPHPQSGGSTTMDQLYAYYGPTDRYDFKIVGKKEIFIPYNNTKLMTAECTVDKMNLKGFPNPDCLRWELHRVWVSEGTLKADKHHIFSKRTLYHDEDTYNAGIADNFDMSGKIYRVDVQIGIPTYHDTSLGMNGLMTCHFDLQTGVYLCDNTFSPYPPINGHVINAFTLPEKEWQPEALAGGGVR